MAPVRAATPTMPVRMEGFPVTGWDDTPVVGLVESSQALLPVRLCGHRANNCSAPVRAEESFESESVYVGDCEKKRK